MSLKGKLSTLRFGRGGRQHAFTSAAVIVAAVAVVSFFTWLNDAHKPLARSIEEAVERSLPETLEQVDAQVAALFGVDEESVRNVREGLRGLVTSRPERLIEIATGQPLSTNSMALTSAVFPAPSTAVPDSAESSPAATNTPSPQTTSEPSSPAGTSEPAPPPTTDTPPATEEPTPPTEEPSPPSEVPSPPIEESPPPATGEPPPAAGEPALPEEQPAPPAKGEELPATKTSPVQTKGAGD